MEEKVMNLKKILAFTLALIMTVGMFAGCGKQAETTAPTTGTAGTTGSTGTTTTQTPEGTEIVKESPMLAEQVAAGTLPALEERLPVASDIMIEEAPANPQFGGTLRRNNGGEWDYGPFTEEPLFRLTEDGGVTPNVAKGYNVSSDGLVYTIYLREGMRWSDGAPFTAHDVAFYYNYMLVTDVTEEGKIVSGYNGTNYNWYKTTDPADGIAKPAIVTVVDDYTVQIKLYAPKPLILQNIAIDNKWMFAPKHWYKDIVAYDTSKPHWTGLDHEILGGAGLTAVTQEEAVANAAARNARFTFDDYTQLGNQLGYMYWSYKDRPTLRAWVMDSEKTDQTFVFVRNPYFWKTDSEGRQLPYIDRVEMVTMDNALYAQEMISGNLDMAAVSLGDIPTYKAGETMGNYTVHGSVQPNWTTCSIELNQSYKDEQYRELFANIDFRHALSIAVDRDEMNEILYAGLATPAQAAAPEGTPQFIEGAREKWTEFDPAAANALLDGIDMISNDRNADGYRTFVGGEHDGEAVTINLEGHAKSNSAQAIALMAQYLKEIGIQLVEISNTARNTRQQKVTNGNEIMALYEEKLNIFNPYVRPDRVAANRNICTWVGMYGLEHANPMIPVEGTPMAEIVALTHELATVATLERAQEIGDAFLQSHVENTWIIGYLSETTSYTAMSNKVQNFDPDFISCDELRFYGNAKPYTWFLAQ